MQGFFDSLIFSPQNPRCNDFFENFHKILIPCLESRVMKLMTRNLVEIEANLWHGISDPELMTRHSTNDTELFRKMTSLILMGKISPPGHCLIGMQGIKKIWKSEPDKFENIKNDPWDRELIPPVSKLEELVLYLGTCWTTFVFMSMLKSRCL